MGRPGIMLYFDILEPIRVLPDDEKGRLLVAMLEYGQTGALPELDGALKIVWSFVRPMIDKDGDRYEDMKLQREYAAFCKKRKRIWMPKISFDEWVCMSEYERQRAVDPVSSRYPTTIDNVQLHQTVSNNNEQYTNSNVQLQPSVSNNNPHQHIDVAATATDKQLKLMNGELGKGVVMLSEEQTEDLLNKMDLDCFDYYVDKLASFIIKNDAKVKNHYETILKWWNEDRGIL
jgi:hypothetical protein